MRFRLLFWLAAFALGAAVALGASGFPLGPEAGSRESKLSAGIEPSTRGDASTHSPASGHAANAIQIPTPTATPVGTIPGPIERNRHSLLIIGAIFPVIVIVGGVLWYARRRRA